jgi:hypothetical protein
MTTPFSFFANVGYPFGGVLQKTGARIAPGYYLYSPALALAPKIKILQKTNQRRDRTDRCPPLLSLCNHRVFARCGIYFDDPDPLNLPNAAATSAFCCS